MVVRQAAVSDCGLLLCRSEVFRSGTHRCASYSRLLGRRHYRARCAVIARLPFRGSITQKSEAKASTTSDGSTMTQGPCSILRCEPPQPSPDEGLADAKAASPSMVQGRSVTRPARGGGAAQGDLRVCA